MQLALDAADIQAIADKVIRTLMPILTDIRDAARRPPNPPLPVVLPAPERFSVKAEIVRRKEVVQMTGLSSSTLWRLECNGRFPARISLSEKRVGWRRTDVEAWINAR